MALKRCLLNTFMLSCVNIYTNILTEQVKEVIKSSILTSSTGRNKKILYSQLALIAQAPVDIFVTVCLHVGWTELSRHHRCENKSVAVQPYNASLLHSF